MAKFTINQGLSGLTKEVDAHMFRLSEGFFFFYDEHDTRVAVVAASQVATIDRADS